jgi:hypothetical protein
VSGKVWKDGAEKRASADKNAVLGTSWEKKMQEKALRKAFLEQKAAAQDTAKEKRKVSFALTAAACCLLVQLMCCQAITFQATAVLRCDTA